MGKAGKALKQVLATYGISQNQLAIAMEDRRSNVSRWVKRRPRPNRLKQLLSIRRGLQKLNPAAAEEFFDLYLSESDSDAT
ncbi:MAG: XRE family transcriptional regulator [Leptolyngbyaceae cyanobacterium SM1_3_5]|nr:XRE family transcriptional regulator [Leptolyngbyaceae cyanobacterium SM1_3_5]